MQALRNLVIAFLLLFSNTGAAQSTVVGAGSVLPVPVEAAPGELATIFVDNLGANITEPIVATSLPLPKTLGGVSVTLQQSYGPTGPIPVPLLAVFPVTTPCPTTNADQRCGTLIGINLQVPFELDPGVRPGPPQPPNVAALTIAVSGISRAALELRPLPDHIHVLRDSDVIINPTTKKIRSNSQETIVVHADGSRVTVGSPARPGETLVMYAIGLGRTSPPVQTGQATGSPAPTVTVAVRYDFGLNLEPSRPTPSVPEPLSIGIETLWLQKRPARLPASVLPIFSGLTPGFVGLYQINFVVPEAPDGLLPCAVGDAGSNLTVSIGVSRSFDGAAICVLR